MKLEYLLPLAFFSGGSSKYLKKKNEEEKAVCQDLIVN